MKIKLGHYIAVGDLMSVFADSLADLYDPDLGP